jgi:flagellar hook-length control protein FliK
MTNVGKLEGSTPLPQKSGSEATDGPAPEKPFDKVMQEKDGQRSSSDSGGQQGKGKEDGGSGSKKTPEPPTDRPKTVAEYRAMKAAEKGEMGVDTADALARQNPALHRPMEVKRPVEVQPTSRVEGMIAKEKIDSIVDQCRIGVNRAGATEMQFDLKSEVLGGLSLKVSTVDGRVYATFLADQPGVKDLVDLNAQALEKALRDRGLAIGEIKTEMKHGQLPDERQQGEGSSGGDERPSDDESTTEYLA